MNKREKKRTRSLSSTSVQHFKKKKKNSVRASKGFHKIPNKHTTYASNEKRKKKFPNHHRKTFQVFKKKFPRT